MEQIYNPPAVQADPNVAYFTVDELLSYFVAVVVSGGGFSRDDAERYFCRAAAALGVKRDRVESFNLGDMRQLTPEQIAGLDEALFGNTGFTDWVAARVSESLR